jgi:hypothetical protein
MIFLALKKSVAVQQFNFSQCEFIFAFDEMPKMQAPVDPVLRQSANQPSHTPPCRPTPLPPHRPPMLTWLWA